jgi:3-methylfumaryl-CoA hydratase
VVIEERQSLVYRAPDGGSEAPVATPPAAVTGDTAIVREITPPLLFRYSALTFNSHRIHYDLPYASQEEGYPGLVVHGPLQATLLFQLAAQVRDGRPPDEFSFRSAAPLFAHDPVMLHAGRVEAGRLELWSTRPDGPAAMKAEASWL